MWKAGADAAPQAGGDVNVAAILQECQRDPQRDREVRQNPRRAVSDGRRRISPRKKCQHEGHSCHYSPNDRGDCRNLGPPCDRHVPRMILGLFLALLCNQATNHVRKLAGRSARDADHGRWPYKEGRDGSLIQIKPIGDQAGAGEGGAAGARFYCGGSGAGSDPKGSVAIRPKTGRRRRAAQPVG
jgi:hypothetical protein